MKFVDNIANACSFNDKDFFSDYEKGLEKTIVPTGSYTGKLTGRKLGENSKGTKYVEYSVSIQDGEFKDSKLNFLLYATAKSARYSANICKNMGIDIQTPFEGLGEVYISFDTQIKTGDSGKSYCEIQVDSLKRADRNTPPQYRQAIQEVQPVEAVQTIKKIVPPKPWEE